MKKILSIILSIVSIFTISTTSALAHVVVRPNETTVATYQTFTVSVPNEKDMPTTSIRVVIPEGLESVTPNVKPNWDIAIDRQNPNDRESLVTQLTWTGSIPVGQRDEFLFSAKTPAKETSLVWKAYQTYEDGTVVSWDVNPDEVADSHSEEHENGPYSSTKIIDDLKETDRAPESKSDNSNVLSIILSIAALAVAIYALRTKATK